MNGLDESFDFFFGAFDQTGAFDAIDWSVLVDVVTPSVSFLVMNLFGMEDRFDFRFRFCKEFVLFCYLIS